MDRGEYEQLANSCNFLEHYHLEHTTDKVTRFRGKNGNPDIYVVSDPEWRQKLRDTTQEIFVIVDGPANRRV